MAALFVLTRLLSVAPVAVAAVAAVVLVVAEVVEGKSNFLCLHVSDGIQG
jgi:hypothetical protein